jgi:hypothetical protein
MPKKIVNHDMILCSKVCFFVKDSWSELYGFSKYKSLIFKYNNSWYLIKQRFTDIGRCSPYVYELFKLSKNTAGELELESILMVEESGSINWLIKDSDRFNKMTTDELNINIIFYRFKILYDILTKGLYECSPCRRGDRRA